MTLVPTLSAKEILKKNKAAVVIIAAFVLASLIGLAYDPIREFLTSPTALREWVRSLGTAAPFAIIGYHALQVVIPAFPGLAVDIANGYVFGFIAGLLLSVTGIALGSLVALAIARRFGRPLVKTIAAGSQFDVEKLFAERRLGFFFLIFLIPGGPHDVLTYIIGLVRAPFWKLFIIAMAGRLPTIAGGVLLGASGSNFSPAKIIGLTIIVANIIVPLIIFLALKRTGKSALPPTS